VFSLPALGDTPVATGRHARAQPPTRTLEALHGAGHDAAAGCRLLHTPSRLTQLVDAAGTTSSNSTAACKNQSSLLASCAAQARPSRQHQRPLSSVGGPPTHAWAKLQRRPASLSAGGPATLTLGAPVWVGPAAYPCVGCCLTRCEGTVVLVLVTKPQATACRRMDSRLPSVGTSKATVGHNRGR
jgi:hypothetical protein